MNLPKKADLDTTSTEDLGSIGACSTENLQLTINVLPYQISPSALTYKLNSCTELNLLAKGIWQQLFADKDIHLHTVIYNKYRLARIFNVHPRTIQRAIDQLIRNHWLKPTKYADHGGVAEFAVTMPTDVFECIIQGNYRKAGPLNYENRERNYVYDHDGKTLFTYYINPNGTKTIVLNEELDIHAVAKLLQGEIINGSAANEPFCADTKVDSTPVEAGESDQPKDEQSKLPIEAVKPSEVEIKIKAEIVALQEKIDAPELASKGKYQLVRKLHSVMAELDEAKEVKKRGDTCVALPINKYTIKITSNVARFPLTENRYANAKKQAGEGEPICYRNSVPVIIPEYFVRKIDEAIETYRESISDPAGIRKELLWAISRQFVGKPKDKPNATFNDIMRFNTCVAIKKIRYGEWTRPAGFKSQEVINAEKKTEFDKERLLRGRAGRFCADSATGDAVSIKSMLEKSGRV